MSNLLDFTDAKFAALTGRGYTSTFIDNSGDGKVDRLHELPVGIDLRCWLGLAAKQPNGQPGADHGDGQ